MKLVLDTNWEITYDDLRIDYKTWKKRSQNKVLRSDLPCDVHVPLINEGIIKDPVLSDYCFDSEWISEKSWWFKKVFFITKEQLNNRVAEIVITSIDGHADIYINDTFITHHKSAFSPVKLNIKDYLKAGENILVICLISGEQDVEQEELSKIEFGVVTEESEGRIKGRGDRRRVCVRKPVYVYGFDWAPKVVTIGIVGDAYIEFLSEVKLRDVWAYTKELDNKKALLVVEMEIEGISDIATLEGEIELSVFFNQDLIYKTKESQLIRSGYNYKKIEFCIDDVQLWWPNGIGNQPLYNVYASVVANGVKSEKETIIGVRTIELSLDKQDEKKRKFEFVVNGISIFCKGGNWVPADSIYARVTDEKYECLVCEAQNANFNMLRIWGGGIYERDIFYKKCDEYGILIWHDFMYACALYPDYLKSFREISRLEADYQTKRLRGHACMALWSGNNENQWLCNERGWSRNTGERCAGSIIYDQILPEIIHNNSPQITYWNSSPYGGEEPNSDNIGDVHHWMPCMMNDDITKRIEPKLFDLVNARFVTEFGYPGPCCLKSIETYFDGHKVNRNSAIWDHHNNTFEKDTVDAGIKKHYTDKTLSLNEYLLYAGMAQSLMLEYALESMRFNLNMGGALFWMYDDAWGETGWSIIDYYMQRKISFYGVRRAFAPRKLILRELDGKIVVHGVNETNWALDFDLEIGYITFDGNTRKSTVHSIHMPANSREELIQLDKKPYDGKKGTWFAYPSIKDLDPAILMSGDIKKYKMPKPEIVILESDIQGKDLLIKLKAKTFAYGICAHVKGVNRFSDNWFNMLPGQEKMICIYNGAYKDVNLGCLRL